MAIDGRGREGGRVNPVASWPGIGKVQGCGVEVDRLRSSNHSCANPILAHVECPNYVQAWITTKSRASTNSLFAVHTDLLDKDYDNDAQSATTIKHTKPINLGLMSLPIRRCDLPREVMRSTLMCNRLCLCYLNAQFDP